MHSRQSCGTTELETLLLFELPTDLPLVKLASDLAGMFTGGGGDGGDCSDGALFNDEESGAGAERALLARVLLAKKSLLEEGRTSTKGASVGEKGLKDGAGDAFLGPGVYRDAAGKGEALASGELLMTFKLSLVSGMDGWKLSSSTFVTDREELRNEEAGCSGGC